MSVRVQPVAASNAQNGQLHILKDCSAFATKSLPYCTITSSSLLTHIPTGVVGNPSAGSLIIYDQPENNWAGMLDSNVVLYIGVGNWATGRCTLNPDGSSGLCTFSGGVGQLAGFTARVDVTYAPSRATPTCMPGTAHTPLAPCRQGKSALPARVGLVIGSAAIIIAAAPRIAPVFGVEPAYLVLRREHQRQPGSTGAFQPRTMASYGPPP